MKKRLFSTPDILIDALTGAENPSNLNLEEIVTEELKTDNYSENLILAPDTDILKHAACINADDNTKNLVLKGALSPEEIDSLSEDQKFAVFYLCQSIIFSYFHPLSLFSYRTTPPYDVVENCLFAVNSLEKHSSISIFYTNINLVRRKIADILKNNGHTVLIAECLPRDSICKGHCKGWTRSTSHPHLATKYNPHPMKSLSDIQIPDHHNLVKETIVHSEHGTISIAPHLEEPTPLSEKIEALSESQAIDLMIDLCHGLKTLHDQGIAHLDISPNNILLLGDQHSGRVMFSDFESSMPIDPKSLILTATHGFSESDIGYPPDILTASVETDIFAMGLILLDFYGHSHIRERFFQDILRMIAASDNPPRETFKDFIDNTVDDEDFFDEINRHISTFASTQEINAETIINLSNGIKLPLNDIIIVLVDLLKKASDPARVFDNFDNIINDLNKHLVDIRSQIEHLDLPQNLAFNPNQKNTLRFFVTEVYIAIIYTYYAWTTSRSLPVGQKARKIYSNKKSRAKFNAQYIKQLKFFVMPTGIPAEIEELIKAMIDFDRSQRPDLETIINTLEKHRKNL